MPDIDEMARPASGHDDDDVDAEVVAVAGIAWRQRGRRRRNPPQAGMIDREIGVAIGRAGLDLDERQCATAPRDQVDLADMTAPPPVEDPPTLQPQPPCRDRLAAAAPAFGCDPAQARPFSARARV
jgi:hypothetical protein